MDGGDKGSEKIVKVMDWIETLKEDTKVWARDDHKPFGLKFFIYAFLRWPEFRRLVHYRIKGTPLAFLRPLTKILSDKINLYLWTNNIGSGLKINHGFSSIVLAHSIGKNFSLYQCVTIGWGGVMDEDGNHVATIGDNVTVHPGAKIFGGIHIGDDVEIGANAVVLRDIPSHSIVVGVPARVIKRRNKIGEPWKNV